MSKNKKSLADQIRARLNEVSRFGHSKHEDKKAGVADKYIYSYSTWHTYDKHLLYFVAWAKEYGPAIKALGRAPRTLAECRPYAADWLLERQKAGMSAYTLKMERSALAKLYGEPIQVDLVPTRRSEIKRSRGVAVRDKHFSEERNAEFVNFCRCAGPRRNEYAHLTAAALKEAHGRFYVHYKDGTKGGRERYSPIVGTPDEVARAVAFLRQLDGTQKAPGNADVHAYRADYATKIYTLTAAQDLKTLKGKKINYTQITRKRARDGSDIYKSALYFCRGDRKGDVLDRRAMLFASAALGHNRESVVGEHYIRLGVSN